MGAFIRLQDLVSCPPCHSFSIHIVAVEVIQYHHVIVSRSGDVQEMVGLIYEDLAGRGIILCEHYIGALALESGVGGSMVLELSVRMGVVGGLRGG